MTPMTVFPDWDASHQSSLDELVVMFEDIKVSVLECVCRRCQVMHLLHFEVSVCRFLQYLSLGYTMPLSALPCWRLIVISALQWTVDINCTKELVDS
jgi:hypothetical protein